MNGAAATRAVLRTHPQAKVIALSMHVDADIVASMREAGAVAYLTKGGPSQELVAAIRSSVLV
jgi:DNA-binding NarL/FixJ family response regulator